MTQSPLEVSIVLEPGSPSSLQLPDFGELLVDFQQAVDDNSIEGATATTPYAQYRYCALVMEKAYNQLLSDSESPESINGWAFEEGAFQLGENGGGRPIWSVIPQSGDVWDPRGGGSMPLIAPASLNFPGKLYLTVQFREQVEEQTCTIYACPEFELAGAYGVVLVFDPSRTKISNVTVSPTYLPPTQYPVHFQGRLFLDQVWQINYEKHYFASNEPVPFQVTFRGDPPILRNAIWLEEGPVDPDQVPTTFTDPPQAPPSFVFTQQGTNVKQHGLANYAWTYDNVLEEGRNKIPDLPQAKQGDAFWFWKLDRVTNPQSAHVDQDLHKNFILFGTYLAQQYMARAEVYHLEGVTKAAVLDDSVESWKELGLPVGEFVMNLILGEFRVQGTQLDEARFAKAFESFAHGEFALENVQGVPNGTNYFSFVELGLFMIKLGKHEEFWRPATRILARTAEIYLRSFHGCGKNKTRCAFSLGDFGGKAREWSPTELQTLEANWMGLTAFDDWVDRYVQVVHGAVVDELPTSWNGQGVSAGLRFQGIGCPPGFAGLPLRPPLQLLANFTLAPLEDVSGPPIL